jgi:hypothetical protein
MNTLRKFKLKTTPRRAAIEYITSIHQTAQAEGIKTLARRIEEMKTELRGLLAPFLAPNQTYFFAELYCVAVCDLISALTSLMELNTIVSTYCNFRASPCSSLFEALAEAYNSVELSFASVGRMQEHHLRTWILPYNYAVLAESQLERCRLLRAWVADDPAKASSDLYEPDETLKAEQAQIDEYNSVLATLLSLQEVDLSGNCLAYAEQQLFQSYLKHKQYAELLAIRRGYTMSPKGYLLSEDIRDPGLKGQ